MSTAIWYGESVARIVLVTRETTAVSASFVFASSICFWIP